MDIAGTIKVKGEEQKITDKFRKREFVITDNSSQYAQHITFELTQDRVTLIDQYNVGDEIKVHFNLRGREWTNPHGEVKYFNSLEAWKIDGITVAPPQREEQANDWPQSEPNPADDLPF